MMMEKLPPGADICILYLAYSVQCDILVLYIFYNYIYRDYQNQNQNPWGWDLYCYYIGGIIRILTWTLVYE